MYIHNACLTYITHGALKEVNMTHFSYIYYPLWPCFRIYDLPNMAVWKWAWILLYCLNTIFCNKNRREALSLLIVLWHATLTTDIRKGIWEVRYMHKNSFTHFLTHHRFLKNQKVWYEHRITVHFYGQTVQVLYFIKFQRRETQYLPHKMVKRTCQLIFVFPCYCK